jgi:hypothetical protein
MAKISARALDGSPIFDSTEPLKIQVNSRDIANADRKDPADCVMARAVRRCIHAHEVRAHLGRVFVRQREKGPWKRYETSTALRSEIIAFDRGGAFEPGEYMLRKIRDSQTSLARSRYSEGRNRNRSSRKGRAQKKRMAPHTMKNVRGGPVL